MKKLIKTIKAFMLFRKKYTEMNGSLYYNLSDNRYI